jgi:uncharacterized protein (TIGR00251 family)
MPGGILLQLHIQPGASKTELAGRHGDALKIRIASPPSEGRANQELLRFLSGILAVPGANVVLVRGETSRRKVVSVRGISRQDAARRLGVEDAPS